MKTILNYLRIRRNTIWKTNENYTVCVVSTNWFDNWTFNPTVMFYYIQTDGDNKLYILDRYSFANYMTYYG